MIELEDLLRLVVKEGASDLHLTAGSPPQMRIDEKLVPVKSISLTPAETQRIAYSILSEGQKREFEDNHELDLSFGMKDVGRFRANIFRQRGSVGAAFRLIPSHIPSFEVLGLPKVVEKLASLPKGLVLVTGPTGCGKSTTLAALVEKINSERHCHIITVEDPIEYMHKHNKSIVNQREVGSDTHSFARALKYILREDPDIILIGEMRDVETVRMALESAETGHLVFATLHTSDAAQTVNRIIDIFPSNQQNQVRTQLSFVMQAVISQQLIPKREGKGRVLSTEVMIATPAVRALIREEKSHQIYSVIQTGNSVGMHTMNQSFYKLYREGLISYGEALSRTTDVDDLERLFRQSL